MLTSSQRMENLTNATAPEAASAEAVPSGPQQLVSGADAPTRHMKLCQHQAACAGGC